MVGRGGKGDMGRPGRKLSLDDRKLSTHNTEKQTRTHTHTWATANQSQG